MGVMTLSPAAAQRLSRFRRRTWLMVALGLVWQVVSAAPVIPAATGTAAAQPQPMRTTLCQEQQP